MELLKPTNDYVFKRIFGQKKNSDILKDLLQAILPNWNIKNVEPRQEVQLETDFITDKVCRLDILATLDDGTKVDVEMQMKNERNTEERATEYMGKMISEQLQVGEDYQNLKKSIVIFITNYNFLKRNSYHSVGRMKFDKTLKDEYVNMGYEIEDEVASKYIEVHYIELPKFKKKELSLFPSGEQPI